LTKFEHDGTFVHSLFIPTSSCCDCFFLISIVPHITTYTTPSYQITLHDYYHFYDYRRHSIITPYLTPSRLTEQSVHDEAHDTLAGFVNVCISQGRLLLPDG